MTFNTPSVLLIDSYDSFTFNLVSLIKTAVPSCNIYIIKNDQLSISQIAAYTPFLSAIFIGPGPGSPAIDSDIGVIKHIWKLDIPIFGVCFGLQSLCVEHGGRLKRLDVVKHGQASEIFHADADLYDGIGKFSAVRYHSLHVDVEGAKDLELLAWADDGMENGRVVMAVKHRHRPFWGVQYHPESVCSEGGVQVLRNFWRLTAEWRSSHRRVHMPDSVVQILGGSWPYSGQKKASDHTPTLIVTTEVIRNSGVSAIEICEYLGVAADETSPFILLQSSAQPGRYTIIASLLPTSLQMSFTSDSGELVLQDKIGLQSLLPCKDIWSWVSTFMSSRAAVGGDPNIPFWGGLVGLLSYELGVDALGVNRCRSIDRHPDLNMVYVERSIVLDHESGNLYLQSLLRDDQEWLNAMKKCLSRIKAGHVVPFPVPGCAVVLPDPALYKSRIDQAKEFLSAGDSYELCLTAQTRITVPSPPPSSWSLFKTLQHTNPAPYSAFLRLNPTTFLSSSPERFLSRSREGVCQMRPIKGTLSKRGGKVKRAEAEKALKGSIKEVAENLMIVDLIQHDLHSILGEGVTVKEFCTVEEYETVWQLVSVIEGTNAPPGWDVLKMCLPPGSMTGAPKKRSVEILQTLEDTDRSLYSGVFGYWCVSGQQDWAVTIRSCFNHNESENEWIAGAGGAITALSDTEAEWEEMKIKLDSILGCFSSSTHL